MNLTEIAIKHGTDKCIDHFYTPVYARHFAHLRKRRVTLLEIGVGGYENPAIGGNSLRMWADWFTHPESVFIGIDIHEKNIAFEDIRIKLHKGSQTDHKFLERLRRRYGGFDIVIDDGSHIPNEVIKTFQIAFPMIRKGGMYVVEDVQTSYWKHPWTIQDCQYDESSPSMSFFKQVPDWINYAEIPNGKAPDFFEKNITGIHFYHNLVVIDKNENIEKSNVVPSKLPA